MQDAVQGVVDRAAQGDQDALAVLWRAHQHLLLRYFRGRRAASPEDLASQVWIDVAHGLHRFRGDDVDFRRWLFTIARRRHIDELRRDLRHDVVRVDLDSTDSLPTAPAAEDELHDGADALDRALSLVRRLPDDMAEAVLLRVVADLSVAEAAVVMGRSEGNVRVLTHRGLQRLREKLVTREPAPAMDPVT